LAKFRKNKFFKKQQNKPDEIKKFEVKSTETITVEKNTSVDKSTTKSWIKSGTKYIYIIAAAALLSGIFTPFTIDVEGENVVYGMLILFIGVGGGILIFKGVVAEKTSTIFVCLGSSFITISLILIFQIVSILR
jgi:ABC-type uncharacterized transport system permease subunit